MDDYERLGELHDLFMDTVWERIRPTLTAAFSELTSESVIVDIGAGTGVGTRELAACTPARIVAIEPSLTMRSVLLARAADDPDLRERVSVVAGYAPAALDEVSGPVDGFVCAHMLGHLDVATRSATFGRLAQVVTPDVVGVAVVSPDTDAGGAAVDERRIGRHRYIARFEPADGDQYISEYEVLDGDRVVRHERFTGTWTPITVEALAAEVAPFGFAVDQYQPGIGILRAASDRPV